eukprot:GEMP01017756.1.p1 GENE.GEMP01017756.1~~GEMP01017756.1.p1  ORF type:complete len:793 (+),score=202.13 GEMP01017756.1:31-2409(+)
MTAGEFHSVAGDNATSNNPFNLRRSTANFLHRRRRLPSGKSRFASEMGWQHRTVVALDKLDDATTRYRGCTELRQVCDDLSTAEIEPFLKRVMDRKHPLQQIFALRDALLFLPYVCERHPQTLNRHPALVKRMLEYTTESLVHSTLHTTVARVVIGMWRALTTPSMFHCFVGVFFGQLRGRGARVLEKEGCLRVLQHLLQKMEPDDEQLEQFIASLLEFVRTNYELHAGLLVLCSQLVAMSKLESYATHLTELCIAHLSGSSMIPKFVSHKKDDGPATLTRELAHACSILLGHLAKWCPDTVSSFRVEAQGVLSRDNLDLFRLTRNNSILRRAIHYATREWEQLRPCLPPSPHSPSRHSRRSDDEYHGMAGILNDSLTIRSRSQHTARHGGSQNVGRTRSQHSTRLEADDDEELHDVEADWEDEDAIVGGAYEGGKDEFLNDAPESVESTRERRPQPHGELEHSVDYHDRSAQTSQIREECAERQDIGIQFSTHESHDVKDAGNQWENMDPNATRPRCKKPHGDTAQSPLRRVAPHRRAQDVKTMNDTTDSNMDDYQPVKVTWFSKPQRAIPLSPRHSNISPARAPSSPSSPSSRASPSSSWQHKQQQRQQEDVPFVRRVSNKSKIPAVGPGSTEATVTPDAAQSSVPYLDAAMAYIEDARLDLALECVFRLGNEQTLVEVLSQVHAAESRRLPATSAEYLAQLLLQIVLRESTRRLDGGREQLLSLTLSWLEALLPCPLVDALIHHPETHMRWHRALFMLSGHSQVGSLAARLYYATEQRLHGATGDLVAF